MSAENIIQKSGSVKSSEGLPIYYDLYVPFQDQERPVPVVLFLHGFKGFKDWGPFPTVCRKLAQDGFAVLAMNFSLNGVGESMKEFDQLDLFARQTLSQDLDDVGSVIEALKNGVIQPEPEESLLDTRNIGVLGHSRGGHTAVCAAAEFDAVQCLVTWSAVADYNARWSQKMISDWEKRGVTEIKNGRTGQVMPVKKVVYEDALSNADRVIALNRVKELNKPSLFIHSKDDEAVSYTETEKLYRASGASKKEILLLAETGHTFGGAHPFDLPTLPKPLKKVLQASQNWFARYLQ